MKPKNLIPQSTERLASLDLTEMEDQDFTDTFDERTQSLELNQLFLPDAVTESGSFRVSGVHQTTLGRLLDAIPIAAMLLDPAQQTIVFSNKSAIRLFGGLASPVRPVPFSRICVGSSAAQRAEKLLGLMVMDRSPHTFEATVGTEQCPLWGRIHLRSVRVPSGRFILVLIEDLTAEKRHAVTMCKRGDDLEIRVRQRTADLMRTNEELKTEILIRKQAQKRLDLAAKVIASANEAILITDLKGSIIHVNKAFTRITGYSKNEVLGKNPKIMASGRHDTTFWAEFWQTLAQSGHWRGEVWDRRKNGEVFPKMLAVSAVKNKKGLTTHYVAIFSDISTKKESEERMEYMAHYDPLTGLPNRLLFRDRLRQALQRVARDGKMLALMFIDLDLFKNINDTFGHSKGDELLTAVAERLTECVRQGDTVARLGGDEFTVIMSDVPESRNIIRMAQRIMGSLSKPFYLKGHEIFTTASIGISVYPMNGVDGDTLLKHADTAMYHAKDLGKNNFQFFSQRMNEELTRLMRLEITLRRAIESNGLILHYQPIIDTTTGHIVSMEALLRIKTTQGKILSAGAFISVAEERGLIVPLGEWILATACRQNQAWQAAGYPPVKVAVNVSLRQLKEPDPVSKFMGIVRECGMDPRYLELELTESAIMENPERIIAILKEFRKYGVSISIDDFGTGYSSLSRLRYLPIDKLKIDMSFVSDLTKDATGHALITTIVTLAHSLGMTTVAEGVEHKEQLDILRTLRCDTYQGFYFSRAVNAAMFERLLGEQAAFRMTRPTGVASI